MASIQDDPRLDPRVKAVAWPLLGTMHGQEIFSIACPDVSADTALSIADFARTT